jgi:dTDP-3-amino-3,4,6-trideoxy-alpha-D-glucose transaminase
MRVPFVSLSRQNSALRTQLVEAFARVLDSGRYLMGPEVEKVERALADWHGTQHAVATGSGTDSCELALRAMGLGDGSTVATPAFGAVPTISAIEAAGCRPVLVDVDPITRGVSFETLAQVRTAGAIVVHMFGQPCDVPKNAVEDCAHAQGARKGGRLVGTLGMAGALSFFPTKCLGNMGDGGAVITSDPELAARVRALRHYGGLLDGDVTMRGQNSRMSELGAAVVAEKLAHLEAWNRRRREIAKAYIQDLGGLVKVPQEREGDESAYHVFVIEHPERDRLKTALEAKGISCMVHYPKPIHFYHRWNKLGAPGHFPVSERLAATVLSLPMFPELEDAEVDAVIKAVKECA